MQISISARHGDLSADTQQQIRDKVSKLTRFWDRLTSIQVTVDVERREEPFVEIRVTAEHSEDFVGSDRASNLTSALDSVTHKLETQIRRHKEKVIAQHRGASPKHMDSTED